MIISDNDKISFRPKNTSSNGFQGRHVHSSWQYTYSKYSYSDTCKRLVDYLFIGELSQTIPYDHIICIHMFRTQLGWSVGRWVGRSVGQSVMVFMNAVKHNRDCIIISEIHLHDNIITWYLILSSTTASLSVNYPLSLLRLSSQCPVSWWHALGNPSCSWWSSE